LGVLGGDLPAPAKADAQDHADHNHADHDHDDRNGGGDQAFHDALLSWTFRCDSIDKLTELTATALETFPRLTSLDTAYLDAKTQKAQTLTSRSPSLRIR
jgi:hypothetical protein